MVHRGQNAQDRRAVAITCATRSQLISTRHTCPKATLLATLGVLTVARYHFTRCIMQYPGNHCQQLEAYTNFRVVLELKLLQQFEGKTVGSL